MSGVVKEEKRAADSENLTENGIYYRTSESFSERGYSREKLTEMLVNAGFELEAVYGDMSFDEPKADEQRLVFVARMKNPINKEC